ncbi:DNA (cytosine-5-)-methyltransferase [Brevundimonas sp. FT23028]|uniref:DNA (cytosine-5-)-methyltransferase n=1 Tax=Brevundimonas sp. FT23028 TaxID=3393748 RepID=UPI003B5891D1
MNIATLFSGVGTPELALKALGVEHKTIFACEIDKYARKTYLENNQEPNTFYEDVTKLDANKYLNQIDILIGGFPCQAFSIAGKQLGFEDTRGTLFFDCARIVKECKPKVFVFENVKGLISHDKPKQALYLNGTIYKKGYPSHFNKEYDGHKKGIGKTLYTIEAVLIELGYPKIYWDVVNTKDYGIPQNRERIYIVGFKDEVGFEFAPKQELKLRLKDMLEDYVDEKYLLNQTNINLMNTICGKDTRWRKMKNPIDGCAGAICATHSKGLPRGVIINNKEIQEKIYKEGTIKLEQVATLNIKGNDSIKRIYSGDGLCPSLTTMQGGHREPKVAIASGVIEIENDEVRVKEAIKLGYKVAEEGDSINISVPSSKTRRGRVGRQVAQTLDTACNQVVFKIVDDTQGFDGVRECEEYSPTIRAGRSGLKWSQNNYIFRKLTPRECFRLQGFDDSFIFPQKMSDTQLYKQAGNGMSRNVLEMIFTKILTSYTKYIKDKK